MVEDDAELAAVAGVFENMLDDIDLIQIKRYRRFNLKQNKQNTSKLKIIPLGGLEQIGMNITAFEYEDSIVVVDFQTFPYFSDSPNIPVK